jgi:phosphocarrier protein HPr
MSSSDSKPEPMREERVRIRNRMGMHARPAAEFVKLAGRYRSEISVSRDGVEVNGKSIMGVLMLAAEQGAELRVRGVGEDAEAAVEALTALIDSGFGEELG